MEQAQAGWVAPPGPINENGRVAARPEAECNLAYRFGVVQTGKLRGRDDLLDSLTKTACAIRAPITLPGWGQSDAAARILAENKCACPFGKDDSRTACNVLPARPRDARYAVIALRDPNNKIRYGFRTRAQLFVATAAVLHYTACRELSIPAYADSRLPPLAGTSTVLSLPPVPLKKRR